MFKNGIVRLFVNILSFCGEFGTDSRRGYFYQKNITMKGIILFLELLLFFVLDERTDIYTNI